MAINRRQCDRNSLLANCDHRWTFFMLAQTMTGYIVSSTNLGTPAGGLNVPGSVLSIGKWLQECHGPSVIVKDSQWVQGSLANKFTGVLALDLRIIGLDVAGDYLSVPMRGLNGQVADSGNTAAIAVVHVAAATGDIFRLNAGAGTWAEFGFVAGDKIFSANFLNSANNDTFTVLDFPSPTDMRVTATNLTTEAAGTSVVIRSVFFSSSGKLYQCPQAFSYVDKIVIDNISGNVAGDLIRIGSHQPRAKGNQVRYALPFKLKNANNLRQLYDRSNGTTVPYDIQLANGTFEMQMVEAAAGTHRFTAAFDPRLGTA